MAEAPPTWGAKAGEDAAEDRVAAERALAAGPDPGRCRNARTDHAARWRRHPARRLKDTPAIGPLAKLRLKSEIEDLMHDLAAFHSGHTTETLEELPARYRDLVLRVIALLEQGDVSLAHDLTASTDHLWTTLADPGQFAAGEELNSRRRLLARLAT
jgi:hypothetical protein